VGFFFKWLEHYHVSSIGYQLHDLGSGRVHKKIWNDFRTLSHTINKEFTIIVHLLMNETIQRYLYCPSIDSIDETKSIVIQDFHILENRKSVPPPVVPVWDDVESDEEDYEQQDMDYDDTSSDESIPELNFPQEVVEQNQTPKHVFTLEEIQNAIDKVTDSNMQDQAFSAYNHVKTQVSAALSMPTTVKQAVTSIEQDIHTMKTAFEGMMNNAAIYGGLAEFVIQLCKIGSFLLLLNEEHNQNLTNIIALLLLIAPANIGAYLQPFVHSLGRAITGIIVKLKQQKVQLPTISLQTDKLLGAYSQKVITMNGQDYEIDNTQDQVNEEEHTSVITGLFELIRFCTIDVFKEATPAKLKAMTLSASRIKIISDAIKGIKTITEFFFTLFHYLVKFLYDLVLISYGVLPTIVHTEEVEVMIKQYTLWKQQDFFTKMLADKNKALQFCKFRQEFIKLEGDIQIMQNNNLKKWTAAPYLGVLSKSIDEAYRSLPAHMQQAECIGRDAPFTYWMVGMPGIGKSFINTYILHRIVMATKLMDHYEHPTTWSYSRAIGVSEYWEKWHDGIIACCYDDLFQVYADEQTVYKTIDELTKVINEAPFNLETAYQIDKGTKTFRAPIVAINSQQDIIGAPWLSGKCLSVGTHLYRRRDIVFQLLLNSEYSTEEGTLDQEKLKERMKKHPELIVGLAESEMFMADMYLFQFTHPLTGEVLATTSFPDGIKRIEDSAKHRLKVESKLKYRMDSAMQNEWKSDTIGSFKVDITDFKYLDVNNMKNEKQHSGHDKHNAERPTRGGVFYRRNGRHPVTTTNVLPTLKTAKYWRKNERLHYNIDDLPSEEEFEDLGEEDQMLQTTKYCINTGPPLKYDRDEYESPDEEDSTLLCNQCSAIWLELSNYVIWNVRDRAIISDYIKLKDHGCFKNWQEMFDYTRSPGNQKMFNANPYLKTWEDDALMALEETRKGMQKEMQNTKIQTLGIVVAAIGVALGGYFGYKWYQGRTSDKEEVLADQTHEGSRKVVKTIVKRQKPVILDKSMRPHNYSQANLDVESLIKKQFALLELWIESGGVQKYVGFCGTVFCVGSDVFVLPRHYWHKLKQYQKIYEEQKDIMFIKLAWNNRDKMDIPLDTVHAYLPESPRLSDCCFLRIRRIQYNSDVSKHFIRVGKEPNTSNCYLFGVHAAKPGEAINFDYSLTPVHNVRLSNQIYESREAIDQYYGQKIEKHEYIIPNIWRYSNTLTTPGLCTSILINTDNKCQKLMGFHIAGNPDAGVGTSICLYYEDIQEAFEYFTNLNGSLIFGPEVDKIVTNEPIQSANLEQLTDHGFLIIGKAAPITNVLTGEVIKNPSHNMPRKTKIKPTLVAKLAEIDFGPCSVAPAKLSIYKDSDGNKQSPLHTALNKLQSISHMVDQEYWDKITDHINDSVLTWESPLNRDENKRLLTDFEIVNGVLGLNPMDLSTSPGYPFTQMKAGTSKKPFFKQREDGLYEMKDELLKMKNDIIESCTRGITPPVIFADTLKDEPRLLDKVTQPRLFQAGEVAYLGAMRQMFGTFVAFLHSTKFEESAVGINPTSIEWNYKVRLMKIVGEAYMNIDYKRYDSSLAFQICMGFAKLANAWYNDGPVNAIIRETLLATGCQALHIIEDLIYQTRQGNPSGFFLTTILNNYCNEFFKRYAYIRLVDSELKDFRVNLNPWDFGDDNITAIHERITHIYNMVTYSMAMAAIGVTCTSADKDEITKKTIPLKECTFLKRDFYYDPEVEIYKGRLEKQVIKNIIFWTEADPESMPDLHNQMNSALYEMSQYGKTEFEYMRSKFRLYCHKLTEEGYNIDATTLFTFGQCKYMMYPEIYPKVKNVEFKQRPAAVLPTEAQDYVKMEAQSYDENELRQRSVTISMEDDDELNVQLLSTVRIFIRKVEPILRAIKKELNALIFNESQIIREILRTLFRIMVPHSALAQLVEYINVNRHSNDVIDIEDHTRITFTHKAPHEAPILIPIRPCLCHDKYHVCNQMCIANCEYVKTKQHLLSVVCTICDVPVNDTDKNFKEHLQGRRHQHNKRLLNITTDLTYNDYRNHAIKKLFSETPHIFPDLFQIQSKQQEIEDRENELIMREVDIRMEPVLEMMNETPMASRRATSWPTLNEWHSEQFNSDWNINDVSPQATDDNDDKSVETISTFYDKGKVINYDPAVTHIPAIHTPGITIGEFLNRPYMLNEFNWTASNAFKSLILSIPLPQGLYNVSGNMSTKLANIAFIRPNMKITMRINGSPMHYGRLVVSSYVNPITYNTTNYFNFENIWTTHWNTISPNAQNEVEFPLKYRFNRDVLRLYGSTGSGSSLAPILTGLPTTRAGSNGESAPATGALSTLWQLLGYVMVPLQSVTGTAANVNVSTWAAWDNLIIRGYIPENVFTTQAIDRNEQQKSVNFNTLSINDFEFQDLDDKSILWHKNDVQDHASTITAEPEVEQEINKTQIVVTTKPQWSGIKILKNIGNFLSGFGALSSTASSALAIMGLSVPISNQITQPIMVRAPRTHLFEDQTTSIILAPIPNATIELDFAAVFGDPTDLDVKYLASLPIPIWITQITSANQSGDTLWRSYISPTDCGIYRDYISPNVGQYYFSNYDCYITHGHRYWSGGQWFGFYFCLSQFQSARFRFTWRPYFITGPAMNMTNSANCVNETWNITGEMIKFVYIPYYQDLATREVDMIAPISTNDEQRNGIADLMVVNELTSGVSPVNPGWIYIFSGATADRQYFFPTLQNITSRGIMSPQGLESILKTGEQPVIEITNYEMLMKAHKPPLGGIEGGQTQHRMNYTTETTSIRQLMNMVSPYINPSTASPAYINFGMGQFVFFLLRLSGTILQQPSGGTYIGYNYYPYNMLLRYLNLYQYYKGSRRFVVIPQNDNQIVQVWMNNDMQLQTSEVDVTKAQLSYVNATPTGTLFSEYTGTSSTSFHQFLNLSRQTCDFTIPWNSPVNCAITAINVDDYYSANCPCATVMVTNTTSNSNCSILMGAGDDFMVGYRRPMGRMARWQQTSFNSAVQITSTFAPRRAQVRDIPAPQCVATQTPVYIAMSQDEHANFILSGGNLQCIPPSIQTTQPTQLPQTTRGSTQFMTMTPTTNTETSDISVSSTHTSTQPTTDNTTDSNQTTDTTTSGCNLYMPGPDPPDSSKLPEGYMWTPVFGETATTGSGGVLQPEIIGWQCTLIPPDGRMSLKDRILRKRSAIGPAPKSAK